MLLIQLEQQSNLVQEKLLWMKRSFRLGLLDKHPRNQQWSMLQPTTKSNGKLI
mgnify:CR=1 FL=1